MRQSVRLFLSSLKGLFIRNYPQPSLAQYRENSIFSSKDEPEDGGWGFLRSWGSFLVFWF